MTINMSPLKGDLNGKIVVVRFFFFCQVYMYMPISVHVTSTENFLHIYPIHYDMSKVKVLE